MFLMASFPFPLCISPPNPSAGGGVGPRHQETKGLRKKDTPALLRGACVVRHQGLHVRHGGRGRNRSRIRAKEGAPAPPPHKVTTLTPTGRYHRLLGMRSGESSDSVMHSKPAACSTRDSLLHPLIEGLFFLYSNPSPRMCSFPCP
jgi:hypothetical protein